MIEKFFTLYPGKLQLRIKKILSYASFSVKPEKYGGIVLINIFMLSIGIAFWIFFLVSPLAALLSFIGTFILAHILLFMLLDLIADNRAKLVETVLPDVLTLFSINLKSGHTTSQALLQSAKPEFGLFKEEIDRIGTEIALGKSFNESMMDLSKRIKSVKLERAVRLIVSAHESGGKLSDLAESIAEDLRQQKETTNQVRAQIDVYAIFIFIAISIGAPLLYSLSTVLIKVVNDIMSEVAVSTPENVQIGISLSTSPISVAFVFSYAIIAILLRVIFGSLTLGLIKDGKERHGLKYIPVLAIIAFMVFFVVRYILTIMMGEFFI
jgi:flagellar protein FlaJ